MSMPAVIGIVCFSLAILRSDADDYYQIPMAPMGIIGKVYANSMLVLINSRMLLDSESTIISGFKFFLRYPPITKISAIHAHNGNVLDTEALAGPLRDLHPEGV